MIDQVTRRRFMNTLMALGALGIAPAGGGAWAANKGDGALTLADPKPFDFAALVDYARQAASKPYAPPELSVPDITEQIGYSEHGKISFPPERALFREGEGIYPATFFHLGRFFQRPVRIHAVQDGMASEVTYRSDYFDMPADSIARKVPDNAGFAGFRLHEAKTRDDWKTQDWIAFLGASYFRTIGDEGQYGLSARGIAIDTAIDGAEEFPNFTAFYIEPARSDEDPTHIYAMLDGPSLTGAYHFTVWRKEGVVMDVDKRLFFRKSIERLGIAPLTSMFWYAEYDIANADDWRPEVHDSDGLALWTGHGERIWRPLNNPPRTTVSSFADATPKGFGLLQRDRDFRNYLDGVRYERRPSLWVEPHSDWGRGTVQLVEIPTNDEIHDNIVAFWVPEKPVEAGDERQFGYRLFWQGVPPAQPEALSRCFATRMGRGGRPGTERPDGVRKFVIDFGGGPVRDLEADAPVEVSIEASRGELSYIFTEKVPGLPQWRAQFDLTPSGDAPIELRAFLHLNGEPLSETWLYQYHPDAGFL